jgi:hypothetical protein
MIEELWNRYAMIWSMEGERRAAEMAACLVPDVTYTDPQVSVGGLQKFADYMDGFRRQFPGHSFRIKAVVTHHDRSLARWEMVNADGAAISPGISFAIISSDGKFVALNGFYGGIEAILH